jgi:HEAT repeat protein
VRCSLLALLILGSIVSARSADPLQDYQRLSVEARRAFFGNENADLDDPARVLEWLILGLREPDPIVQRKAAAKTAFVMLGLQKIQRDKGSVPLDVRQIETIQNALIDHLSNTDSEVRGAAVQALAFSAEPNAKIEEALLAQFGRETNGQVKGGILEVMARAGYESDKYLGVLRAGLLASDDKVREAATRSVLLLRPPDVLPLLARALEQYKTGRRLVINVMAAYGTAAQPYLKTLETVAADPSLPSDLRDRAKSAVRKIKEPAPPSSPEPRSKALSLVGPAPQR